MTQSWLCLCRETHAEDRSYAPGLHVLGLHVAEDASDGKQRQVSRAEHGGDEETRIKTVKNKAQIILTLM